MLMSCLLSISTLALLFNLSEDPFTLLLELLVSTFELMLMLLLKLAELSSRLVGGPTALGVQSDGPLGRLPLSAVCIGPWLTGAAETDETGGRPTL